MNLILVHASGETPESPISPEPPQPNYGGNNWDGAGDRNEGDPHAPQIPLPKNPDFNPEPWGPDWGWGGNYLPSTETAAGVLVTTALVLLAITTPLDEIALGAALLVSTL